jgi:anti-sigma factor RsiW
MTTCKTIQPRLTAYLDGELTDERGSVVRGHLRECEACRQTARDEAALRDHLRTLPPVDPPASLWAGVQAQLAAAEVADARTPRWRRAVARWTRWTPSLPRFAGGGLVAAVAIATLWWRAHRADEPGVLLAVVPVPQLESHAAPVAPPAHEPQQVSVPSADDVTADLIAEPSRTTASYAQVIEELMKLASEARSGWSDAVTTTYDARIAMLRDEVRRAAPGRPQQRAQRVLIHYLQRAVVGEDTVLASGGAR